MRIVAGRWRGHAIQAPPGRATRPTTDRVREAWMSALLPWLLDARVLDLFAGSGALGLEALSRGAAHVTFVEIAGGPLKALRTNIERLGAADDCAVVRDDAMHYVKRLLTNEGGAAGEGRAFDIALADPPYDRPYARELAELFAARPFADWLWLEHRARDRLPELPGARTRKYGDTALTRIPASAEDPKSGPGPGPGPGPEKPSATGIQQSYPDASDAEERS